MLLGHKAYTAGPATRECQAPGKFHMSPTVSSVKRMCNCRMYAAILWC